MLRSESLKKYIDEIISEVEKELDEATATGDIAGYETPNAFSDGSDATKRRKKKIATQLGMQLVGKVESVNEDILTEKQFKGLEGIPANTSLEKITKDQKLKIVKGVGNIIDFIVPKGVSRNFWQVIGTGKIKKNLSGEFYLEGKIINSPMFKSIDDLIDGIKWKSMEERRRFNEGVNESWTVKDGSVLSNGKLIGYYDFDRDSDSFWVDDVKKGKGQVSFDTKKEVEDYFKKNEKDAVKHLQKLREGKELKWQDVEVGDSANVKAINKTGLIIKTYGRKFHLKFPNGTTKTYDANELTFVKNESINENRWLELKNDESMHANKKLAVGLKELKHQLSEVETFLRWYNQIKTMNELDSNQYWKRTNSHIYKIKERIINIARTLQEIEK